jgi:hypothetical protein
MITTYAADEAMFSLGPEFSTWRTATLTSGMLYIFVNYAKIVDICLLEPFRRDKISTTRWTKVLEVRSYEEDSVEHPVYVTDAGETVGLTPEEAKKKMKLIYKARHVSPKAL